MRFVHLLECGQLELLTRTWNARRNVGYRLGARHDQCALMRAGQEIAVGSVIALKSAWLGKGGSN